MSARATVPRRATVVGGGPAGLMAAETLCAAGISVDLWDAKGSVGRKFLLAGKGGLNLTHSEPAARFVQRYRERSAEVGAWLRDFGAGELRAWSLGLGIETFVGSSGRVFPRDMKAAPLLRAWVRRLRESGVRFHVQHRWVGWTERGELAFETPHGRLATDPAVVVLALGGGSWPQLGSDGGWVETLAGRGVHIAPLRASNCGFDVDWSEVFARRFAGAPIKPVVAFWRDRDGAAHALQGECVATATGIEGSLVYALSAGLRELIEADGRALLELDLAPGRSLQQLASALARPRQGRSFSEHLRRQAGLHGVKAGLVRELCDSALRDDPQALAAAIKRLPLVLLRPRPVAEAISSAGGVRFESLDAGLMLRALPGVFCAGEMLDWEAPTGGYLLTACFASGRCAGLAAAGWLRSRPD
jgi:hypothetical protein